jgi:hypothetical protein
MQTEDLPGSGPLSDDLMIGAIALAAWLGVPPRKVFYIAETKQLPFFKIGGKLAGRKSTIREHIAKLERDSAAA